MFFLTHVGDRSESVLDDLDDSWEGSGCGGGTYIVATSIEGLVQTLGSTVFLVN